MMNFDYYTAIASLEILSLLIMQIFVSRSISLTREKKHMFQYFFGTITLAIFCEWAGVRLQDGGMSIRWLHILAKATELSIAPSFGFMFGFVLDGRWRKAVYTLLFVHGILEFASGIWGFIYSVDVNGHYAHAGFYWIYILVYMLAILYILIAVMRNIRKYQYSGASAFVLIIAWVIAGIGLQLADSQLKVSYTTVSIGGIMAYLFTLEMIQQTDELTELLNRRGYENCIAHLEQRSALLFFDVDKFKYINDTFGHAYGDQVLKAIGLEIKNNYARFGKCFRYGGDEFCVVLSKRLENIEEVNSAFFRSMQALREKDGRMPTVSIGYAYYDPLNSNIQDTAAEADRMMYKYKHRGRTETALT